MLLMVQDDNDQAQRRQRQLEDILGDLRDIIDMQEDKVYGTSVGRCSNGCVPNICFHTVRRCAVS